MDRSSMMFFRFEDGSLLNKRYPYIRSVRTVQAATGDLVDLHANPSVAVEDMIPLVHYVQCEKDKGRRIRANDPWPDILGGTHSDGILPVTRRVLDALEEAGIERFRADPIVPEDPDSCPGMPEYVGLILAAGIESDREEERANREQERARRRLIPIRVLKSQTWEGHDLFDVDRTASIYHCCTARVIELARQHRWTNCRFVPMDAMRRYAISWKGVDYLGKQWPPRWYPPRPSEGKSAQEWFDQLLRGTPQERYVAKQALKDVPEEALRIATAEFHRREDAVERYLAGSVIWAVHLDGTTVEPELLHAVQAVQGAVQDEVKKRLSL